MPTQLLPTHLPEDVYTVDLDRGRVTLGHHHIVGEPPTPLPRKAAQRFQRRCLAILKQVDLEPGGGEREILSVVACFRFVLHAFKGNCVC
jgi:hypothetical protein